MKLLGLVCMIGCIVSLAAADEIVVQRVQGEVSVRHGVMEQWTTVAAGDVLRPGDTMKTGKKGQAVLVAEMDQGRSKKITLPQEVIVDLSDIRQLSQEELMLKLTMEKVRASSYEWKNEELHIPNAAVIHGSNQGDGSTLAENDPQTGVFQWNGAKVLFANGFYSTCVLRAMEIFRLYPEVGTQFENRLMVADALVNANLRGEAMSEYGALLQLPGLKPEQEALLKGRMSQPRE